MSVVGFDLGNESCIVAVARQRGIDVVLNEESKRETPAIVCFGDKQRFIGTAGAASSTMNPKNSISQIKRLLGRKFSDPELQSDLASFPFRVTEGPDGFPLVHVRFLGEERTFTPTQLLAMVLSNLKGIAEGNLNAAVCDCCIGIPVYFSDLHRRAVLDAATIAGLRPLRLFHETTATALAYGICKTDLPENDQLNVAFVDVGHASMQVSIVGYKKGQLKMLSHAYDRSLGGRDFDEALFKHFAAKFKEEYKIDAYQNARACLRLRVACEKLKKVLSANPEAPLNIECLMDEKDVRGFIKRDEFEQISAPVLERVKGPLEKALAEAGLTTEDVHFVEVVGSGSRVPAIIKIITEFFGKEPRRTINASACVARGCALQCAMLSPTFKVREFQVNDGFPLSIAFSWKSDSQDSAAQQILVFPKGNAIPSTKALTFYRSSTFEVDVLYVDTGDTQILQKISTYTIGPFQPSKDEKAKLKIKVRLNIHGIVTADAAIMLEEEDVEVPVSSTNEALVEPSKKEVKKTSVPVHELVYGALAVDDLQKAVEEEYEMALQDRVMEETKEKKNAVEAYVYDMRNKLYGKYSDFEAPTEKEGFIAKLQEVEDWLYEDGEDETKGVYIAKLEELKKIGDPIEARYKEWTDRASAVDQLVYCIKSFRDAALSNDQKFDHIDISEKQKVINECSEAENWLRERKQQQEALPKHANPVLLVSYLRKKAETLDRFCKPIMTKPKPAPKPQTPSPETLPPQPETQAPEPQTPEQQQNGAGELASEGGAQETSSEQDGEDVTKEGYIAKLEEHKKVISEGPEAENCLRKRKQQLDAYVYDMRSKLYDKYSDFVTSEETERLIAKLQEVEDWLYEDGEDETKGVYIAKLGELKKIGDPIEARFKEWAERASAVGQLEYCLRSFREAALSSDQKFDHIDMSDKQKVINECSEAENWLRERKQQQDAIPKHANPVLLVSELKNKAETLDRFCKPIMTKPKPAPKPQTPPPQPETQAPEPQTPGGCDVPVALDGPGDLSKDAVFRSECSCRSGCVRMVCVECALVVYGVSVHEEML